MTQGEIEKLSAKTENIFSELEIRIMQDIVRRLKENGVSTATSDWQITRLQQLGKARKDIVKYIQDALKLSDEEVSNIFSDKAYEEYNEHARAYELSNMQQVPFDENIILQELIEAVKEQLQLEFKNLTASMGFAIKDPSTGKVVSSPLLDFYRNTMDQAVMDIQSGAFDYSTVLKRTINQMTASGMRYIDYDSGHRDRVNVAARRAVLTGFRQVQGKINEQVARELKTDKYEVSYHVGARPDHQPWQGKVWTMQELIDVCGLGTGPGLLGWNCYHDYKLFPPGSKRTYTDEQLQKMLDEENTPKEYNGKQYTTYEALQQQRKMERNMRAQRQKIKLLQEGGADEQEVILAKAKYQGQMQTYRDFSEKMKLPVQKDRIMQDGLSGKFMPTKTELSKVNIVESESGNIENLRIGDNKVSLSGIGTEVYSRKFNQITSNTVVNDSIRRYAKAMLTHRNGSDGEDLYIISAKTGKRLFSKTTGKNELGVELSEDEIAKIKSFAKSEGIIGMHNHPTNILPTGSDFVTAGARGYKFGIVATHDGRVFQYRVGSKPFRSEYFNRMVDKYVSEPYNYDIEKAQVETLTEFEKEFGIKWKELK